MAGKKQSARMPIDFFKRIDTPNKHAMSIETNRLSSPREIRPMRCFISGTAM